jgi:hypothetical protein
VNSERPLFPDLEIEPQLPNGFAEFKAAYPPEGWTHPSQEPGLPHSDGDQRLEARQGEKDATPPLRSGLGLDRGSEFVLTGDDGFAEFKAAYPPEGWTHPECARKAWLKLAPGPELRQKILIMLEIQKASRRWDDSQFIPNPATYLNRRYFDDDPKAYPRKILTVDDRCPDCHQTFRVHPWVPGVGQVCPEH